VRTLHAKSTIKEIYKVVKQEQAHPVDYSSFEFWQISRN
jgi:hypothetical protein